ncbi:P-loop containing nucleoside triphosphate hydrolase protein [Aspergillus avenaceus]|uniref:P-loop containing nucleoside triphosphate hydrolase protein n=1 Tax=Aspergillus avenaceus TaxID=36643 RepID=A0A5N6TNM9_ASPAV|nr:P-loop containing nucleoside triphosphate hydrolase protein [Aspergillus avenaceus]
MSQLKRPWGWNPSWLSLFSFTTRKHIPTLCVGILFTALASSTSPLFATSLGQSFNAFTSFGGGNISSHELMQEVSAGCIRLACLGLLCWFCSSIYFIFFAAYGELQVAQARGKLFDGLLQKNQEWFETQPDGTRTFLSCLQSHVNELQKATSQPLGLLLQYTFRAIGSLALAFYTSWNLSLVTLAGIPLISAAVSFLSSKIKPKIEAQQRELAGASKVVNSATGSIDTVKCLNGQAVEIRNFLSFVDQAASQFLRQAQLNSIQIALIRLMSYGMFVQGFWYGSNLVSSGQLSPGEVFRTFWACLNASQSVEFIMTQVIVIDKGAVAATALNETLNHTTEDVDCEGTKGLQSYPHHCEGDIEVSELSFAYASQPDRPSLKSVSFFFPAGETTFVIGKSGSGKSTLSQLLSRLYSPTSGEIRIDGMLIQNLSKNWIRKNVTLVEQKSVLFNESIFMNIAFGRHDYDYVQKEDVQECIDLAMLDSIIDHMPNGIDTCVGQGGGFLSGGQRQRVAIARARLRDTPILILDEPTSALDGKNRNEIMRAIRKWRKGKTTIIITHDMSHILDDDFIYVLDQGSVAQAGYRVELEKVPGNEKFFPSNEKNGSSSMKGEDVSTMSAGRHGFSMLSEATLVSSTKSTFEKSECIISKCETLAETYPLDSYNVNRRSNWAASQSSGIQLDDLELVETKETGFGALQPHSPYNRFSLVSLPSHQAIVNRKRLRKRKRTLKLEDSQAMSLRQIMLTIIPNLTIGQRLLLALGCFFTLCHAGSTPVFSYCLAKLQATFYDPNRSVTKWALVVLGVSISDGVVSLLMHYLLSLCGQAWVDCLRRRAFCRVLDQPRKWFDEEENSSSQLTACLARDGEEMREILSRFGGYAMIAASIAMIATVWSMAVCWRLTLVAFACGPVIYAVTRGFEGATGLWERRCTEARSAASEIFIETFAELRTVRTLTLEPFFHSKHKKALSRCLITGLRKAGYTGFLFGLVETTIIFVSALIFYYGALLVSASQYTVEEVLTVFSLLLFSIGYASVVLSWIPQIGTARERGSQLLRLANLPEKSSHEHLGALPAPSLAPVEIKNLNFHYPSRPDALVLDNVSFTIPKNSCTAIVGRSGSGKSTIASLLLALYETPRSDTKVPTIALGGTGIRDLYIPTLRSFVAIVSQQPTIFPGTIEANISYGLDEWSPLRTLYNVRVAAKAAGIDDFISSLPQGYNTVIGDGGVGLSGGQAQRVVIARALARQPQILILDEATSSLDPASAEVVRHTVRDLVASRKGLTVIIITHAKEMMEIADNVVVMENGRVVERGPYKALSRGSTYLKTLFQHKDSDT